VIWARRIVGQFAAAIQYTGLAAIIVKLWVVNQLNIMCLQKFSSSSARAQVFDAAR
jgi:hypothetical protein